MHRQTSSTRVLRSRRPDASDAKERDADFVPVAVQRFVAALQTLRVTPSPSSTFIQTHRPRFAAVAEAQRYAVQRWIRPIREGQQSSTWDAQFFSRQALRENGQLLGFDFLRNLVPGEVQAYSDDFPAPYGPDGSHGPLSTFPTFAFMLQS